MTERQMIADDREEAVDEIGELLRTLADTPVRLAALSDGLDDGDLQRSSADGAWSANEILAHLRACADVWGGNIQAMIERDHPQLRYVSPRTWIRKTAYTSESFTASLRAFTAQRHALVRALAALDEDGWARGATFTGTVRGREQTVLTYVRRLAAHELEHCEQIEATLRRH